MSSNLCPPCRQILVKTKSDRIFYPHHSSAPELLCCPCSLCKLLCDGLYSSSCPLNEAVEIGDEGSMTFDYRIGRDYSMQDIPLSIMFTVSYPNRKKKKGTTPASQRFFHQKILVVKSDENEDSRVVSGNTGSGESWKVARRWLETCFDSHSKCGQTQRPKWMPTRLLDIGTQDSKFIHLCLTDETPGILPYTTLSHCWGEIEIKRLLNDNLTEMIKGIRIDELPQTFQDAITITRRLSIRYLWIDSLCIVQDSSEDWARQSSMMGKVYQNGYCNIAATGAPDGRTGCFLERDPMLAQKCRVKVETPLPKFDLKPGLYDLVPRNLWEHGLSNGPLNKRAWVAQERILAPRMLHFASNQLFWECNELDACEMFPNGAPAPLAQSESAGFAPGTQEFGFKRLHFKNLDPASVRSEVQILKAPWTFSLTSPLPSGPLIDPYYVWNKMLLAYTKCALTKEKDKLVAISAVAKQIQGLAHDDYLAGMWKRYLEYHLLWFVDQGDRERARPKEYVAPSWSWASMTGRIQPFIYIRPDNPTVIQILDVRVETVTSDLMGQVSGGFLKLRGWLKKVSLKEDKSWTMRFDAPQIAKTAQFDEYRPLGDDEVWYLPVVTIGPWLEGEVYGLILEQTGKKDEFRRVGRFRARSDIARVFRRPAYPIESDHAMVLGQSNDREATSNPVEVEGIPNKNGSTGLQAKEKKFWFRMRIKTDEKHVWTERVITII